MKKPLLLLFLLSIASLYAQEEIPPLLFEYDTSGNQILSDLVCVNCPETAEENHHINRVNYYPNPVVESLNLNWNNTDTDAVSTIKVYSLNGKLVTLKNKLNSQREVSLNFNSKAAGIYIIEVLSSDGQKSSFKIIKQ